MHSNVRRIFVEKKPGFDVEAQSLFRDIRQNLGVVGLEILRIINRYDIEGITEAEYQSARQSIFAEPPVDQVYDEELELASDLKVLAFEYLPGQYDQRADSAAQCIQILAERERPEIKVAKLIVLGGAVSGEDFQQIKDYCLNPLEAQEASLEKPATLATTIDYPDDVAVLDGFNGYSESQLDLFRQEMGLAMSLEDLVFCQTYFRDTEGRVPTITEVRVLDTYWSDHCRHTTFLSKIEEVKIEEGQYSQPIKDAYQTYLNSCNYVYDGQPKEISLMNLALIAMKELKKAGRLNDLEESDEINACSIVVNVNVDGVNQEWLVMFKNETHNHPTEIEPFGGAATCLGGAIRDPLSGRSYVYHALRVTGCGDPRVKIADTIPGKLAQRKITTGAAAGFSSYGNQIGLATGQVAEVYDEGFVAKRMEIGAVVGAAPRENVRRCKPEPGDVIILLGGRTGRDGCGGATGSSKAHTEESLQTCGAEVQKGNPPTERKIQRLFRNPAVSKLIKICNDFGAGGVSVAIGELAEGLEINLDAVPKKYEGLDGTELAISESQERMAVLIAPEDQTAFMAAAEKENLEVTQVAVVTAKGRLQMFWRGKAIVDISREFLDTNGMQQTAKIKVTAPDPGNNFFGRLPAEVSEHHSDLKTAWFNNLGRLNICSQKGLGERFDGTIGASSVLLPFGGKHQLTPMESMVAKLPVLKGETNTATAMSYGYNPSIGKWSPFHGALYAVIEAVAKIVATGGDYHGIRLTLQEYFEKLGQEPERWGKPFAALLGAYLAQKALGIAAIGGKDSMSGTFKEISVPPTLVAFAITTVAAEKVISPEFKEIRSQVVLVPLTRDVNELPDFKALERNYTQIYQLIGQGKVLAAHSVRGGGLAEAITKMCLGNGIGFDFTKSVRTESLFAPEYGSLILELKAGVDLSFLGELDYQLLGRTIAEPFIKVNGVEIDLDAALQSWSAPLEKIFPTQAAAIMGEPRVVATEGKISLKPRIRIAKPRVFLPVFPGTNCEYDTNRAFSRAGAVVEPLVFRNLSPEAVEDSIQQMVKGINNSQIIMLAGWF